MRCDPVRSWVPVLLACVTMAALVPAAAAAPQIRAALPAGITPPWDKGIQPISRDSYYNAVACGKQGGRNPPCVFWDTGLCRNDDFTLAFYTPYKQVAYEVWQAVSRHQPAPTPSYAAAQRTRIVVAVKPAAGSRNRITSVAVKRGGRTVPPATRSLDGGGGRFIFDFAAFAPTADVMLEMTGTTGTTSCLIARPVLRQLR